MSQWSSEGLEIGIPIVGCSHRIKYRCTLGYYTYRFLHPPSHWNQLILLLVDCFLADKQQHNFRMCLRILLITFFEAGCVLDDYLCEFPWLYASLMCWSWYHVSEGLFQAASQGGWTAVSVRNGGHVVSIGQPTWDGVSDISPWWIYWRQFACQPLFLV
jgi:hypothetical protein